MRLIRGSGCALTILAVMSGCGAGDKSRQVAAPPPPEVTVSEVVARDVTDFGDFTGRTESVETVEVRARVTGYLDEIHFTDGQEVKEGDLLFEIDPRPFQATLEAARGQRAQWEAKLTRAKADVERYGKLVTTGAATAQDLDKARADLGEATASIQSAQAAIDRADLDLQFSRITAPISGRISRALITRGNLVRGDNELLTTIVSLEPMYVYFDVSERDLLAFLERPRATRPAGEEEPDIKRLKIPVYLGLANEQGYPHKGVIDFSDNRVNPETGTIRVRGTFDNTQHILMPGLFARVRVPLGEPYHALMVSERALGIDQGLKYVLTVDDENIVEQRFVEPGPLQNDGLRVIKAGLQPDEWVVVNGLQRARPGKPVTPQREEMPRKPSPTQAAPSVTTQTASAGGAVVSAGH